MKIYGSHEINVKILLKDLRKNRSTEKHTLLLDRKV